MWVEYDSDFPFRNFWIMSFVVNRLESCSMPGCRAIAYTATSPWPWVFLISLKVRNSKSASFQGAFLSWNIASRRKDVHWKESSWQNLKILTQHNLGFWRNITWEVEPDSWDFPLEKILLSFSIITEGDLQLMIDKRLGGLRPRHLWELNGK